MGMTETANRVIQRFGTSAFLVRKGAQSGPDYNPTFGPDIEYPCTAALVNFTESEISGTLIETTDRKALMAIDGFSQVPTVADQLKVSGEIYEIISLSKIETNGAIHLWRLQVRS